MTLARECKVSLKSSNDELFDVNEAVAFESQTIKNVTEDTGIASTIPLPNISNKILSKVIEYWKYHVEAHKPADEKSAISEDKIKTWDQEFVKVDQATLFDLILAANYLNIKNILDLTCQTMADMIKGRNPDEIWKTLQYKE